jgi:hypothetical protein
MAMAVTLGCEGSTDDEPDVQAIWTQPIGLRVTACSEYLLRNYGCEVESHGEPPTRGFCISDAVSREEGERLEIYGRVRNENLLAQTLKSTSLSVDVPGALDSIIEIYAIWLGVLDPKTRQVSPIDHGVLREAAEASGLTHSDSWLSRINVSIDGWDDYSKSWDPNEIP